MAEGRDPLLSLSYYHNNSFWAEVWYSEILVIFTIEMLTFNLKYYCLVINETGGPSQTSENLVKEMLFWKYLYFSRGAKEQRYLGVYLALQWYLRPGES